MSDRIAVMESGRVQQVGTQHEIYYKPANAFVARFIGRSNVLSLPVTGATDDSVAVRLPGGATIDVGAPAGHGLGAGDTALVSARPEHIALGGDDDTAAMRGRISHVEFTGMATHISVDVDGNEVMAALIDAPAGLQLGDVVGLRLVPERLWVVKP